MSAENFIDTSIFLHQLEGLDRHKSMIADRIIRDGVASGNACISAQVVQECMNTVLHKAQAPLDTDSAGRYLDTVLIPLLRIPDGASLFQRALAVQARYRYGYHHSLIIAAAADTGCARLYSEDLQHGQQIEGVTIENPFNL